VIGGLALLAFAAIVVLLVAPADLFFPTSTPTVTSTSFPTSTPTFPSFLPTANLDTPTPLVPSPTNTRLPTATLLPVGTPTATVLLKIPTPPIRPTSTVVPTATLSPTAVIPTATLLPGRQYSILFDADRTRLEFGDCTDLIWQIEGSVNAQIDGEFVQASGVRKICPERDTTYTLTTQLEGSAEVERRTVTVIVEK
jgi:hypothetical protein